ncbi:hypothetical protein EfmAA242_12340 [Enterococcus faecium]|nr:hypothetical protein EfmAA242_12340 [Enterococcus faecium]
MFFCQSLSIHPSLFSFFLYYNIKDKEIADNKKTSGALISFSVENADEVKKFAQIAKENGGTFHEVDMGMPEEEMFSLEVQDLDGNTLEPVWMKM